MMRSGADALSDELRQTICDDVDCFTYQVVVRLFGSIPNNTHVLGSDADIAVIPTGCQEGLQHTKGPGPSVVCDVLKFRDHLFTHLRRRFGSRFVCRQRKAILLCGTAQRMRADVVVLLPRVWCGFCPDCNQSRCSHGYEIRSYCEPEREISTWPEQHQRNAAAFDVKTNGGYTQTVRVLKGILKSGNPSFSDIAACMPSVLFENLLAHVPAECYLHAGSCPLEILRHAITKVQQELHSGSIENCRELSGMRALFDGSQTWEFLQVRQYVDHLRRLI